MNRVRLFLCIVAVAVGARTGRSFGDHPTDVPKKADAERVLLRHRVTQGVTRRYEVHSETTTQVGGDCATDPQMQAHLGRPPAPSQLNLIEFVEEESCTKVDQALLADINYRCQSFHLLDKLGSETTFECRVNGPEDLRKLAGEPRAMLFAGLVEEAIGYTLDPAMNIKEVRLPRALLGAAGKTIQESYRSALQARYQSFFPSEPVAVGDHWEHSIAHQEGLWSPMGAIPELDYEMTTKFVGRERSDGFECAVLEVTLLLSPKSPREVMKNSYQFVGIDSFVGHSRILFAIQEGMPVAEETELRLDMRRVLGARDTLKVETPIDVVQRVRSHWLAPAVAVKIEAGETPHDRH